MKRLRKSLQEYLSERRALGFKLHSAGFALLRFVAFMESRKRTYITTDLAVEWAMNGSNAKDKDVARAQCLGAVREFAKYLSVKDARTEIPPYGILPHPTHRTEPVKVRRQRREVAPPSNGTESIQTLRQAINDYLATRHSLGFKLRLCSNLLVKFASFMEQRNCDFVTTKLALEWAKQPASAKPSTWAQHLGFVRNFAQWRIASDPRTEIPPWDLLPYTCDRARPHQYSVDEIKALLKATQNLPATSAAGVLRRQTYYCLIGLLSITGMRVCEVANLKVSDVDLGAGILTVRDTKFGKSRLIPVHSSTVVVLGRYKAARDEYLSSRGFSSEHFFVTHLGGRLDLGDIRRRFYAISQEVGLRQKAPNRGPRLHDFRHDFAVKTLLRWYRAGEDVERKLPMLSTFLGHVKVKDTYWYLTGTPELMSSAVKLLEKRWEEKL